MMMTKMTTSPSRSAATDKITTKMAQRTSRTISPAAPRMTTTRRTLVLSVRTDRIMMEMDARIYPLIQAARADRIITNAIRTDRSATTVAMTMAMEAGISLRISPAVPQTTMTRRTRRRSVRMDRTMTAMVCATIRKIRDVSITRITMNLTSSRSAATAKITTKMAPGISRMISAARVPMMMTKRTRRPSARTAKIMTATDERTSLQIQAARADRIITNAIRTDRSVTTDAMMTVTDASTSRWILVAQDPRTRQKKTRLLISASIKSALPPQYAADRSPTVS